MSELEENILLEQLDCFQVQRHDFLNNFQVIRGYLQLNMPEKAIEYMNTVVKELEPQQEAYKIPDKHFQALLLGWLFGLRFKGVKTSFVLRYDRQVNRADNWQRYAEKFHGYTKECLSRILPDENLEESNAAIVLTAQDNGFTCRFDFFKKQELLFSSDFQGNHI
ncbi:signal transduction histidine kinase regulating citrate/malate metabolism [Syntrophobotulus glycolicus DSM 8271]|uniref:Signal transduction histidine kinase regulating citrate/malate metabolism n=1 Tax=Syntrophobotulus glycolicus (strain DSM 8271 / FlGlyR) TaxID=645991 RepID=F0SVH1_SYNGF|nr:Spo0B domain-containing protein [Syntrophobotulus glycolicus]ADY56744.1 signal transduction histidine kinase regulating citrate/malate metabolism [Syntrophobotulus glycolicus DSM 8271]